MGLQERKGQIEQGRVHGFPEKVTLELAFKCKWKFPEVQRGCGEDVCKNVRPLLGNFPNPEDPDLSRTDNTLQCNHVYECAL